MSLALKRCDDRWYPLKKHPVCDALILAIRNAVRFPLVPSGRRSGKTEHAKRFLASEALENSNEVYFAAAPTYAQAKKIFWNDLKLLTYSPAHLKQPSESELKIFLPNGTEIHIIGLDKPQRIEGTNWTGGIIDEVADVKSEAVNVNILPALDTVDPRRPDYRAWCWFVGVPDGLNHYYDMCAMAEASVDDTWKVYHWKSAEILPADVIESAKKTLSKRQFQQEYEASFETATGKIYEDYSKLNHTGELIQPHEQLWWMHDQNFTPLSSAVGVKRDSSLYLLDEIVLTSAVSRQSATEFVEKFKDHENKNVIIYGDPAGKAGEKHGHPSDYTDIEDVLKENGWTYTRKVKAAHPAIKDRQNAVRAKICTACGLRTLFVNPVKAPWCDKGLATVQLQQGSTFQEDQKNQYQHITTAIGYCVDKEWPMTREAMSINMRMAT